MRSATSMLILLSSVLLCGCNGTRESQTAIVPRTRSSEPCTLKMPAEHKATWLRISPRNTDVAPGAIVKFSLAGFDRSDREVTVVPSWDATRGTIGPGGEFLAPLKKGVAIVTAEDAISGLKAFAVIHVDPPPLPIAKPAKPEAAKVTELAPPAPEAGRALPARVPEKPEDQANSPEQIAPSAMVIARWRVSGKGLRYRAECSVLCRLKAAKWIKLYAVAQGGRMSLLQSRFAKGGAISRFNALFSRARTKWLEVRLYDERSRLLARERREAK